MNIISLTGRLTKDATITYTKNNKQVYSNTIAVKNDKKDEQGNYGADFIEIVCFEKKAEYLSKYSQKGNLIEVVGKIRTDSWQDDKNEWHNRVYVVADKVQNLTPKSKEQITDDDLPF